MPVLFRCPHTFGQMLHISHSKFRMWGFCEAKFPLLPFRTGNQAFPEFFSDCSVEQLSEYMTRAQPNCLSKPSSSVNTIAVVPLCGNALLDAGEECDCGTVEVNLGSSCNRSDIFGTLENVKISTGGGRYHFGFLF